MSSGAEETTAGERRDGTGVVRELAALPAVGALHRRAAIGLVPLPGRPRRSSVLPDEELVIRRVTVDPGHLARYDRVCGFRLSDTLPATYPHIMAFPLGLRLMTARQFPFPLVGLVHLANRITVLRPVGVTEPLDFAVRATNLRPHDRGRQLDVVATASVGDEVVWRGVSTYLSRERPADGGDRRGGGERRGGQDRPAPPAASARWRVGREVGPAYARVSGDHNPIHTSRLGARLLGFRTPIAHGMWSKARCLAALEGRLPDGYTVEVSFKLPLPLPSTVAFSATPAGDAAAGHAPDVGGLDADGLVGNGVVGNAPAGAVPVGWDFALHAANSGRPHLTGTVR